MFIRDAFCKQYQQWERHDQYKHDDDGKILGIIKENLKVLSEIQKDQSINKLEFSPEGKITLRSEGQGSEKTRLKTRDLREFTAFVKRYFKAAENALSETEAREIKTMLEASAVGIHRLPVSEKSEIIQESRLELLKASDHVILHEKLKSSETKGPGEDLIISKFQELQNKALDAKKKLPKLKILSNYLKGAVFVSIPTLGIGVAVAFVFPPAGFALMGLVGLLFLGAVAAWAFFPPNELRNLQTTSLAAPRRLNDLDGFKKHYSEPEFIKFTAQWPKQGFSDNMNKLFDYHNLYDDFKKHYCEPESEKFQASLDRFPDKKMEILNDPKQLYRFHRLYDAEKQEKMNLDAYKLAEGKKEERSAIEKSIYKDRSRILELTGELKLTAPTFEKL